MSTKFENIEDTELIQEIMSEVEPFIKNHLEREFFIGYRLINVKKKVIANTLNNSDLKGSLIYHDGIEFKELTKEIYNSQEFESLYMRNKSLITGIYVTTHEAFKFILNQLKK